MTQNVLWHDTIYDALGADIAAAGGFKVIASKLWPAENLTTAATKLRNAINPEQAQKLCPEEILQIKRLAKETGSTATIAYEAQQLSYQVEWIQPEDELTQLQRRIASGMDLLNREIKRANDLNERMSSQKLRAVK